MVKEFEFFLKKGDVKKQSPDKNLSKATFKESLERLQLAELLWNKVKAKYVLENAYESMREAADAILYQDGYKSYSHEASIAYLRNFPEVSEEKLRQLDRYRVKRNNSKYYGKSPSTEDADEIKKFYGENKDLFKKIIRSKLK